MKSSSLSSTSSLASTRPVAIWVYTGVIMLLVQVILGGITRLTGSGLSITEWNVVTGAIPPIGQGQWQAEFDKYRQTPQFHLLNAGFSLSDFKNIFFWEWFHRFWARLVGVVFLVGFVWLLAKRKMKTSMIRPLIILFLLGALQGAVGWIMVASGLVGDAIYVQPTKLALHFVFALGLVVYTFWFALQLSVPERARLLYRGAGSGGGRSGGVDSGKGRSEGGDFGRDRSESGDSVRDSVERDSREEVNRQAIRRIAQLRHWVIAILVVLFFQLLYGALMAGHKAANVAPTWPTINGDWVPNGLFGQRPLGQELVGNKIAVQFIHRGLAYILFVMVVTWSVLAYRLPGKISVEAGAPSGQSGIPGYFRRLRWLPLGLIGVQILLGISSLLTSPGIVANQWVAFDWFAQIHQVTGLLFLLTMVTMLYLVIPVRTRSRYPVTV